MMCALCEEPRNIIQQISLKLPVEEYILRFLRILHVWVIGIILYIPVSMVTNCCAVLIFSHVITTEFSY